MTLLVVTPCPNKSCSPQANAIYLELERMGESVEQLLRIHFTGNGLRDQRSEELSERGENGEQLLRIHFTGNGLRDQRSEKV